MSGPRLDHRLVRDYLRDLDAAFARLPADQARELREQITSHLDESLPSGASDSEVAATLSRLGAPAELAAEAAAVLPAGEPAAQLPPPRRSVRDRVARLGWRRWTVITAAFLVVAAVIIYVVSIQLASELVADGASGWWYAQDRARQVSASADGMSQTTVPIRSGQQQGFFTGLSNPSDFTQTITGLAIGPGVPGSAAGSPNGGQVAVNAPNFEVDNGGDTFTGVRFVLPGVIPPHQYRVVRVLWTSIVCEEGKGSATGTDELALRVRIGLITRIEVIPLGQGWYVAGPSQPQVPSGDSWCNGRAR
jgi:hypothetical protein